MGQPINLNAMLKLDQIRRGRQPQSFGSIRNLNTGQTMEMLGQSPMAQQVLQSQQNQKKTAQKKPAKKQEDNASIDGLYSMVTKYNDFIDQNDLPEAKVNFDDFFNKDRPSYISGKDDIVEERKHLQNQFYRLNGDKRFIPTYEDLKDGDFSDMLGELENPTEPIQKPSKLDKLSDDTITEIMSDLIYK